MAMVFLRTRYDLVDLRQPFSIAVNSVSGEVLVIGERPLSEALGRVVAKIEKDEGQTGYNTPQLNAIADSLANAIAYAAGYVAEHPQDGAAWVLSFEPVGDSYWTMNRADSNPGVTPVYHIK